MCSTVQFGVPQILPEFDDDNDIEFDPQLSADGNEIWLAFDTPISSTERRNLMYRSLRGSDGRFGEPVLVDLVNMNGNHTGEPALTADGLRLMFRVDNSPNQLYEAIRSSPDQFPFDNVVAPLGLPSVMSGGVRSFDLTWDGLRLYYTNSDGELYMLTRAARDKPFGNRSELLANDVEYPTISGDELELFFRHWDDPMKPDDLRLFRRERAQRDVPFGPEQEILSEAADPDIAPSSSELIIAYDGTLAIMKRTCDEDD